MNSSQILKRTLPLIFVLLVIIGIAVSCSVFSKEKIVPAITDEEGVYLSITENDRTYEITNKSMYEQLKSSVGLNVLLEKIDTDLLKDTPKGDTNYWDVISEEEIDEAIEKAIFPNGKEDLSEEEILEKQEDYENNMFSNNGLKTMGEIRNYHRLTLAKKLFAEDRLISAIEAANQNAEEDESVDPYFTEDDYENYYKSNYMNGYWTIIVPFGSEAEGQNLLQQLGISIQKADAADDDDYDKWVKEVAGEEVVLTPAEIAKAFIDMYNTVNAHQVEGYPTSTLTLLEDTHYTVSTEGIITFNTELSDDNEDLNELYYSYDDITSYQAEIQNFLKVSMKSYNPQATELPTTKSWYTPNLKSYNNAALHAFILKLGEEVAPTQESVEDEIYEALFEAKLTTAFIATEMVKLRQTKGITIYDPALETAYIENAKSYDEDHKETKEESKALIAKVGEKEYSADSLFDLMDSRYGMSLALTEINFQRLLKNPDFNNIYNYYDVEGSERQKIIDPEKWQKVRDAAIAEKQYFTSGAYTQYGYGPEFGWKNFLSAVYGVETDEELLYYFLYSDVMKEYSTNLGDVSDIEENSDLWNMYKEKMEEVVDNFYKVTGIHLLITVYDENKAPLAPENWTELQRNYAEELYQQVWDYYKNETGTSAQKFQDIAEAFSKSLRFIATLEQNVTVQPELEGLSYIYKNIEVAKFKTAGLSVKFEDLGEFTNGSMVEEFDEAVKSIWDENPSSTSHLPYANNPDSEGDWNYLVTEFGYHAYVNTSTIDIDRWDEDQTGKEGVIPTLQMVKTYIEDPQSIYLLDDEGFATETEFTPAMRTAIETYFTPVKDEIIGNYYTSIKLSEQLEHVNITFNSGNYTRDDFNKFLDLRIESYQSNLKFFAVEE